MSIRDRLKDKASTGGEGPPAVDWVREGQEVAGKVTQVKTGIQTKVGTSSLIVVTDEVTGEEVSVWTSGAILSKLHDDYHVTPGDEVYIRHEGMQQSKNGGNEYRSFAIAHEAAAPSGTPAAVREQAPQPAAATAGGDDLPF